MTKTHADHLLRWLPITVGALFILLIALAGLYFARGGSTETGPKSYADSSPPNQESERRASKTDEGVGGLPVQPVFREPVQPPNDPPEEADPAPAIPKPKAQPFETSLPENVVFLVNVRDYADFKRRLRSTAPFQLWRSPQMERYASRFSDSRKKVVRELHNQTGIDLKKNQFDPVEAGPAWRRPILMCCRFSICRRPTIYPRRLC